MLNAKKTGGPLQQKSSNDYNHDHEHSHEHEHSHSEVTVSRRGVLKWLAASIGIAATATILPSVVKTIKDTSTTNATSSLTLERTYEVDRRTLHKPKDHYCRLKVFTNRLQFEKSCCILYIVKQVLVNGRPISYVQKSVNPLVISIPKVQGKIDVILSAYGRRGSRTETSYTFYC